jgi:catechol 2,3-dioxygenase-like lactoylglutathione lyase family enzyme
MNLGAFSISLSVKDLPASRDFYRKLGFEPFAGDGEHYQLLRNGDHVIGLFQGMFEGNILTFNPGWDQNGANLDSFTDVREIQKALQESGIGLTREADASGSGPDHITLVDPDDNAILIDQHR